MKMIYTPDDGDRHVWVVDEKVVTNMGFQLDIEKAINGKTFEEVLRMAMDKSMTAMAAILWAARRQARDDEGRLAEPNVQLSDMRDIDWGSMKVELDDDETAAAAELEQSPKGSPDLA
jgi:hypothetical protein